MVASSYKENDQLKIFLKWFKTVLDAGSQLEKAEFLAFKIDR